MDDKTKTSIVAELKAILHFAILEYNVFTQFSGKAPFDFVAYKNGTILRVEVKGTTSKNAYGNYTAQLRTVRSNKTINKVRPFDSGSCDVLAIYVVPRDRLLILNPADYHGSTTVTFGKQFDEVYNSEGQSDWRLNLI